MITARRVRRGRPRLGTRGGKHSSPSVHRNSPSRSDWLGPLDMRTTPPAAMPAFRGFEESSSDGVVHLGEGIAVCEEQLRAVKWSDYRKLTRGLAAILFSPTELATCSVTGQRWSRAGTATERPVKPALDKAKVQAIITYVTSRFPSVDVSSVKQVLAYKCKENSTALKMKSIRYICDRQDTDTSPRGESEDKVQPASQFRSVLPHPSSDMVHSSQRSRIQRGHSDHCNNNSNKCVDGRLRRNHQEGHRGNSSLTSSTQAGLEKLMPLHTLHGVFHSTLRTATTSYI
ncbi:hypothetical protein ALC53_04653 [Atta colombica]|uniref:BEN domain-containing protein n=1 Tax=Atta colombica TaxID=520822 RepID=A0A195BL21_9HYME|nr:hypothetical protein ALC53_04653 [Atta colombica]